MALNTQISRGTAQREAPHATVPRVLPATPTRLGGAPSAGDGDASGCGCVAAGADARSFGTTARPGRHAAANSNNVSPILLTTMRIADLR